MAAAFACLEKLKTGRVQQHMQALTERLEDLFKERVAESGVTARLEQLGGKFQVFFTDKEIIDYRSACTSDPQNYRLFQQTALDEGVWMSGGYLFHHGVTAAHTNADVDQIIAAFDKGLLRVGKSRG